MGHAKTHHHVSFHVMIYLIMSYHVMQPPIRAHHGMSHDGHDGLLNPVLYDSRGTFGTFATATFT